MRLTLKRRVFVRHVVSVGLILATASLGADWAFSRMVLGQVDRALLDLALTEANATAADLSHPLHIHEMSPGTGPPSFPRLDKFIQYSVVDLDSRIIARSANLGTAHLPTSASLLARLRTGEKVFETLDDFGGEPVRLLSFPVQLGGQVYAIQVGTSLADTNATVRLARILFLTASASILGAVVLTGAMLARTVLRPIDQIVGRARMIGESALAERLPHPGTQDEMARLVETLNDMLARIEESFEAQRRFTADASHEFRSPLSRLRAELEVTLRRPRERAEYEEALQSCLGEVERLSHLTDELLILARLDAGGPPEAPRSVDLISILHEAVKRLGPQALHRNVALVMDIPPELAVNVAPAALSHVVANVLDNAVKFSPPGGDVTVGVAIEGSSAVVAVSDTGPGIPEDEMPRLFERFYRGSAAHHMEAPGVGLGLAICRALVEGQGGRITVTSARGSGATFRIRLPLAS
ncbi:MAG: HAMP domain-containing protein [Candidatus Rokubacteria bacterium]|nr:HAMP domain-containing protein [Candidatus Rokubacteria bacterium]